MAKTKNKKLTIDDAIVPVEEQAYEVPENWNWTRIGIIAEFERGITFPASAKENEKSENNIPCLRTANIQEELEIEDLIYVNKSYMKSNQKKLVRKDDIIMSSANSRELVGKVAYVHELTEPMTFGGFVLGIRAKMMNPKYLFYYLRYEFLCGNFMGESTQTTNIANINTTTLGNYTIPLPPLSEQQRIVEQIEKLFYKLDEAKEKTLEALDSFDVRKSSILQKAFSGELTKKWRLVKGVTDSRKTFLLSKCCKISSGGTPSRKIKEYYEGSIPWIKTGEIDWNDIYDAEEHISQEAIDNSSAKVYKPGAVLVAMYGMGVTRGRAAILKNEAATNQAVCVLQPNSDLYNKFLFYYFMFNYWEIREQSVGGNQLNLSGTIIGKFSIDIPSFEEQQAIVSILDDFFEKEIKAKEYLETVLEQIDCMKRSVLAKAFRGELGTNNPVEESSIGLLEQIIACD